MTCAVKPVGGQACSTGHGWSNPAASSDARSDLKRTLRAVNSAPQFLVDALWPLTRASW